jgi:cytidylate kinase
MGKQHSESVSSVGHLIERQMLLYEEKRKLVQQNAAAELAGPFNFITISRDVGALGDAVASEIAAGLNWKVYDKEIVDYIAKHSKVRHHLVDQLDEKTQNLVHDSVSGLLKMLQGQSFSNEEYHIALIKTLAALAAQGNAILLGHGGAFVLQDQPGLRVRIPASLPARVNRLSKRWNMPVDKTRRSVLKIDAERRDFIKHHFNQDKDDIRFYHLVFNTDNLTVDYIVISILGIIERSRQQVPTPQPVAYENIAFRSSEQRPK